MDLRVPGYLRNDACDSALLKSDLLHDEGDGDNSLMHVIRARIQHTFVTFDKLPEI